MATKEKTIQHRRSFHLEFLNAAQKMAWAGFEQHDVLFLLGPAGVGKSHLAMAFAINEILSKSRKKIVLTRPIVESGESLGFLPGPQPLDAKLVTPLGWQSMGKIQVGDLVVGRDGKPTKVLAVFPKGKKMVYRVVTTDGTTTECCENHLWHTKTKQDRKSNRLGSVKTTKEIIETLRDRNGTINHFLPRNKAVQYTKKDLPVEPYAMGVLLGDGCNGNTLSFASIDSEMQARVDRELQHLGCCISRQGRTISYNIRRMHIGSKKPARKVIVSTIGSSTEYESAALASKELNIKLPTIKHRCNKKLTVAGLRFEFLPLQSRWSNPVKKAMDAIGLLGKKSYEKFIPDIYKFSSIDDRLSLLRGLMDTDGTVKETGEASYTTTSRQLALDVIEIVRSLGGRASLRSRNRIGKKAKFGQREIVARRISYEFTISLPVANNPFFISRKAVLFKCKYIHSVGIRDITLVGEKNVQCIKVENAEHSYLTDDFIVTHNTFEEKVNPYMMPLYDCIDKLCGREGPQRDILNRSIEIAPIAYLRGRTFDDAVCIFDEAQNATKTQLKLFLTRFGVNSKIIVTGDPTQSDLKGEVALMDVVRRLESVSGVGVVEFGSSSIVRHPMVAAILEKLEN